MDFDPLVVVDVQVIALSRRKHRVILQKANIVDLLLGLEFYNQVLTFPVEHSQMAFTAAEQDVSTVPGGGETVIGAKVFE